MGQQHTQYIAEGVKAGKPLWAAPLFSEFDADKDGMLSRAEFKRYVEALTNEKADKTKIDKMMRNYDPDGNGIELAEFSEASPTFVRKSLIKLASRNGKRLGLMV